MICVKWVVAVKGRVDKPYKNNYLFIMEREIIFKT